MARPTKDPKTKVLRFRCTAREFNRIRGLAKIYARGDISAWLRHAGVNAPRRMLKKR